LKAKLNKSSLAKMPVLKNRLGKVFAYTKESKVILTKQQQEDREGYDKNISY